MSAGTTRRHFAGGSAEKKVEKSSKVSEENYDRLLGKLDGLKVNKENQSRLLNNLLDQIDEETLKSQEEKLEQSLYERGEIKKLNLKYHEAAQAVIKAATLQPENSLYLNEAGVISSDLGQYDTAIKYYEKALASDLKTFGEEHPNVAIRWNNLGLAWGNKVDYDKANN